MAEQEALLVVAKQILTVAIVSVVTFEILDKEIVLDGK